MPTYEYTCTDCGKNLEVFQKFTDKALTVCPSCQGHLRKVFSAVGVVFKGSGFYATDNRSAGAASAAVPAHSHESGSESSPSESSPSKDSSSSSSSSDSSSSSSSSAAKVA